MAPAAAYDPGMTDQADRTRRSYRETWRAWISVVVASVVGMTVQLLLVLFDVLESQRDIQIIGVGGIWILFCLVHTVWTHITFRALTGDRLSAAVAVQRRRERHEQSTWWRRLWYTSSHAPSWSAQVGVVALAAVLIVVVVPGLRSNPVFLGMAMLLVVASWLNTVVSYALHYARLDLARPAIDFPGEEERSYTDYLYLALAVQTTFGTTDASILTTEMRRTAMVHGVLAFVFNSVIVAMIVSLLIGST